MFRTEGVLLVLLRGGVWAWLVYLTVVRPALNSDSRFT